MDEAKLQLGHISFNSEHNYSTESSDIFVIEKFFVLVFIVLDNEKAAYRHRVTDVTDAFIWLEVGTLYRRAYRPRWASLVRYASELRDVRFDRSR